MSRKMIDDGFHAELFGDAFPDGILEIPKLSKPESIIIPKSLIPFSTRKRSEDHSEFLMFYEYDIRFRNILSRPKTYLREIKKFPGIITPDCSVYRDMPLVLQLTNIYLNRAIGYYFQKNGVYVIPNVRWGDERTYTTSVLPEKAAFLGLPQDSILSISTYGCIRNRTNRYYFREGLSAMLDTLHPQVVLVYGAMPASVFSSFTRRAKFVRYENWTSLQKKHQKTALQIS